MSEELSINDVINFIFYLHSKISYIIPAPRVLESLAMNSKIINSQKYEFMKKKNPVIYGIIMCVQKPQISSYTIILSLKRI